MAKQDAAVAYHGVMISMVAGKEKAECNSMRVDVVERHAKFAKTPSASLRNAVMLVASACPQMLLSYYKVDITAHKGHLDVIGSNKDGATAHAKITLPKVTVKETAAE